MLLVFFAVSVVVYAVRTGVQPLSAGDFSPTYTGFIGLVPLLIFNYVGFELPGTTAEEMSDARRNVPFAVLWRKYPDVPRPYRVPGGLAGDSLPAGFAAYAAGAPTRRAERESPKVE